MKVNQRQNIWPRYFAAERFPYHMVYSKQIEYLSSHHWLYNLHSKLYEASWPLAHLRLCLVTILHVFSNHCEHYHMEVNPRRNSRPEFFVRIFRPDVLTKKFWPITLYRNHFHIVEHTVSKFSLSGTWCTYWTASLLNPLCHFQCTVTTNNCMKALLLEIFTELLHNQV